MLALILVFLIFKFFCCDTSSSLSQTKRARETVVRYIQNNPKHDAIQMSTIMAELVNSIGGHQNLILAFDRELIDVEGLFKILKIDKTVIEAEAYLILPYLRNYIALYKRRIALSSLIEKIKLNPSQDLVFFVSELQTFHKLFRLDDIDGSDSTVLHPIIESQVRTIAATDLSAISLLYNQFLPKYNKQKVTDSLLKLLNNMPPLMTKKILQAFEEFRSKLEIISYYTNYKNLENKENEFRRYLKQTIFSLSDPNFLVLWHYYVKFIKHYQCSKSQNDLVTIFLRPNHAKYEDVKIDFLYFTSACEITEYENEENFIAEFRLKNPTVQLTEFRDFFSFFTMYVDTKKRVDIRDPLVNKLEATGSILFSNVYRNIILFVEVYAFSKKSMTLDDFFNWAEMKDNSFTRRYAEIIHPWYEKYVDSLILNLKVDDILKKITENPDIKCHKLYLDMEEFLRLAGIEETRSISSHQELTNLVKSVSPTFVPLNGENIYFYYSSFMQCRNRKIQRDNIFKYIKSNRVHKITDLLQNFIAFSASHNPSNKIYTNYDSFSQDMKALDNLPDDDINILFKFYSNYIVHVEQKSVINSLLQKILKSSMTHQFENEMDIFIQTFIISPDLISTTDKLASYFSFLELDIKNNKIKTIFDKYSEYQAYKVRVAVREALIKMIKAKNKLSEMYLSIKNYLDEFKIEDFKISNKKKFESHVKFLDGNVNPSDIELIRDTIIEFRNFENIVKSKNDLLEFYSIFTKHKFTDFEKNITPFLERYKLIYIDISEPTEFYKHLKTCQDNITEHESSKLYQILQNYKMIKNKQIKRDSLYEFLMKNPEYTDSQISEHIEYFVNAYNLEKEHFSNIEEFENIILKCDENIEPRHTQALFTPVFKYLKVVDRRQKRDAYLKILEFRKEISYLEIEKYARDIYDSHELNDDIIINYSIFFEYMTQLDNKITKNEIDIIQKNLWNHRQLIKRHQIKNAILVLIETHPRYAHNQISSYMACFLSEYQIPGIEVSNLYIFKNHIEERDSFVSFEEIEILHQHLLKYMRHLNRKIIRISLSGMIKIKMSSAFDEIAPFANEYIESYELTLGELNNYKKFYKKTIEMDETVEKSDIKLIFEYIDKYTKSDIFIKLQQEKERNTYLKYSFDKVSPFGMRRLFYFIFKYFGAYPHYVLNEKSIDHLDIIKRNFHPVYKFLTDMDYFVFRTSS